ncbi:AFG1/ZapE family ATPase [Gorillibacterium sp. CAU 1737]|uniref:AFG1/ZapE family ATPase n=1 Tax=Gorillibacterium sp. CAU 1737 TaxID=3140362 RepID=UPI0032602D95
MESLSQALKGMIKPEYRKMAEDKSRELLADPLLQKWRARFPFVTDEDLKPHLNAVYQFLKEYKVCTTACPGLADCPHDLQGHYTTIVAERDSGEAKLYDQRTPCKRFKAFEAQSAVHRRIRSFYVDDRALNEGYSHSEILKIDPERASDVAQVFEYVQRTKERGLSPYGLYLQGEHGVGKTFLMCYLLYELAKAELSGVIVYMPDFAEDLKSMFEEPQKLKETIDLLKETDLLVFDDIGAENLNPWLRDHVLGSILNYRMDRKPTFFTSNHDLDTLERHFSFTTRDGEDISRGRRLMERVRPFVQVVTLAGSNKRGLGRSQE